MKRFASFIVMASLAASVAANDKPAPRAEKAVVASKPASASATKSASLSKPDEKSIADAKKQLYSGQVVLLKDALKKRKIKSYDDEIKEQAVLETDAGELIPIVPDWRGRAFYQDERLRNRKVELIGFQHKGVPYLQVLSVYTFSDKGERQFTDYWCDICAIPMYEIKPCECCQAEIRIRYQKRDLPDEFKGKAPGKTK